MSHGQWPTEAEIKAAFAFFNVSEKSNWKEIRKVYLKTQLITHPDKGGNGALAKESAKHIDVLKRYFKSQ